MAAISYTIPSASGAPSRFDTTTDNVVRTAQQRLRAWMQTKTQQSWPLIAGYSGSPVTLANFTVDGTLGPKTMSMVWHRIRAAGLTSLAARIEADARAGRLSTEGMTALLRIAANSWTSQGPAIIGNPSLPTVARGSSAGGSSGGSSGSSANAPPSTSIMTTTTNTSSFMTVDSWPWYAWAGIAAGAVLLAGGVTFAVTRAGASKGRKSTKRSKKTTKSVKRISRKGSSPRKTPAKAKSKSSPKRLGSGKRRRPSSRRPSVQVSVR